MAAPGAAAPRDAYVPNYNFTFDKGTMEGMLSFDVITPGPPETVTTVRIPIT